MPKRLFLTKEVLKIDAASWCAEIEEFVRAKLSELYRDGIVVAVSGGLDSSVTAALCVRVHFNLSSVPETLLIPLYNRALESRRPDAMLKDEKAVALVARMSNDFNQVKRVPMNETNTVLRIMLTREMDRYTEDFLKRHPEGVVVHIGCGLDTRFERVDNGRAEWYDLDFPEVIELRRKFIGVERERYHLLACSVLDNAWLDAVSSYGRHPLLFLAEGVFVYFTEEQVKSLVLLLRDRFPGRGTGLRRLEAVRGLGG